MKDNQKKPARSVNMATRPQVERRTRLMSQPADYSVDVIRLGQFVSGSAALSMRPSECVLERRLEPRHTSHIKFVGESEQKKRPTRKYYSVDLDEFQL
jgi:hypothetical protein